MKGQRWAVAGGAVMSLAVVFGAFGAHALKARLDVGALAWWQTASQYHMVHGLGLLAVAWVASWSPHVRLARAAGVALLLGLLLVAGSLYTMALTGERWLGAVTPIGGTAWIAGWVCLALAARGGRRA